MPPEKPKPKKKWHETREPVSAPNFDIPAATGRPLSRRDGMLETNWELNGPPVPQEPADSNPFAEDDNPFADDLQNPFATDATGQLPEAQPEQPLAQSWRDLTDAAHAGMQGVTGGMSDELAGAFAGGPAYYGLFRDLERRRLAEAHKRNPGLYRMSELGGSVATLPLAGSLPNTLGAAMKTGAAYGGAAGFGHAEGDPLDQALQTGVGAGAGAVVGAGIRGVGGLVNVARKVGGKIVSSIGDRLHPERVVAREFGAMMPDHTQLPGNALSAALAQREAAVPGATTAADLLPDDVGLQVARRMGASPQAAHAANEGAAQRVDLLNTHRQNVGQGFSDIDDNIIKLSPEADASLRALGAVPEVSSPGEYTLKAIRDITSPAALRSRLANNKSEAFGGGTSNFNLKQAIKKIYDEIEAQQPGYRDLLRQYRDASTWQHGSTDLADAMRTGTASQGASRLYGAAPEGIGENVAVSPSGITARLTGWLDPSRSAHASAAERMLFRPEEAQNTLALALQQYGKSAQAAPPPTNLVGAAPMAGQAAGSYNTPSMPQLSSNVGEAKQMAAMMVGQPREAVEAQLSQRYDPATVRFALAALPNRLPQ